jgi:hypothetical protein
VSVTVRTSATHTDTWAAIPGETRWVDYSCQQEGSELAVYVHTFRRVRERADLSGDVLLWKPGTTKLARRYADGEWQEVVHDQRSWPPASAERVPRRVAQRM